MLTVSVIPFALLTRLTPIAAYGNDYSPLSVTNEILKTIKKNSVCFSTSDHLAGAFLYLQGVENRRWDTIHIVAQHVIEDGYMSKLMSVYHDFPSGFDKKIKFVSMHPSEKAKLSVQLDLLNDLIIFYTQNKTVYWERGIPIYESDLPLKKVKPLINSSLLDKIVKRTLKQNNDLLDTLSASVVSSWFSLYGAEELKKKNWDMARFYFKAALMIFPDNYRAFANWGTLLSFQNDFAKAIFFTDKALRIKPNYKSALLNLSRYCAFLEMQDCFVSNSVHFLNLSKNSNNFKLYDIAYLNYKAGEIKPTTQGGVK